MADADEYDKYFQADHTVETQKRRAAKSSNKHGKPIRNNKISALVADPTNPSHVYVAEATGTVRRVHLEDEKKSSVVLTTGAPLTSLAITSTVSGDANGDGDGNETFTGTVTLFAGCWDKNVYSTTIRGTRKPAPGKVLRGHSDFVKCVAVVCPDPRKPESIILLSGSADRNIVVWDVRSSKALLTLKNQHTTSLSALLVDPVDTTPRSLTFFSTDSSGVINRTILSLVESGDSVSVSLASTAALPAVHPTTVYALAFSGSDLDLLTASADGTAAVLSRGRNWEVETRLEHGGHVRCVAASPDGGLVATGGRDEDVKVWDTSEEKLVVKIDGHFDEVMAVEWVSGSKGKGTRVVSAGLDGTVRCWDVGEEVERAKKGPDEIDEEDEGAGKSAGNGPALTAEEEAELAELMDDDDD